MVLSVVVIGGSAGALDPLLAIAAAIPPPFTVPIVVVLHVLPTQPSHLPEILSRSCARRVVEVEDTQVLCAGTIHIAPPDHHVLIERGGHALALSVDPRVNYARPSIDVLFESAAAACGPAVVGILLSGANADGAAGLHRICDAGGVAIVQAPAEAEFAMMPEAAIERLGAAVRVVPTAAIADSLVRVAASARARS